eukprot:gb/GFBE01060909.1/.p1 GENE.gb/GFBE01060909.1/~~gb/GFBE01060909.1/.p1  ORF type:complete len:285 (+),score=62.76 gb/GFBE01060909.1/:1-855(+)
MQSMQALIKINAFGQFAGVQLHLDTLEFQKSALRHIIALLKMCLAGIDGDAQQAPAASQAKLQLSILEDMQRNVGVIANAANGTRPRGRSKGKCHGMTLPCILSPSLVKHITDSGDMEEARATFKRGNMSTPSGNHPEHSQNMSAQTGARNSTALPLPSFHLDKDSPDRCDSSDGSRIDMSGRCATGAHAGPSRCAAEQLGNVASVAPVAAVTVQPPCTPEPSSPDSALDGKKHDTPAGSSPQQDGGALQPTKPAAPRGARSFLTCLRLNKKLASSSEEQKRDA